MELITSIAALLVLKAVAAAPNAPALAARQEDPRLSTTTGSLTATLSDGTFVPLTTSSASSSSVGGTLTGQFTGGDGNAYPVTSYSNIVVVAGHSLSVGGPGALVGQVIVTEASQGFVANGQNITMMSVTNSPSTASSTMMTTTTDSAASTSSATTTRGPAGQSPAAQPTNSSSSSKAGAATPMATGAVGAVLGGVLGALLL